MEQCVSADHAWLVSAVKAPGYQRQSMIMTSAGQLPSKNIIHVVVGNNDPARIKDIVYSVLKLCEENKFNSVAFPALGTGPCKQLLRDRLLLESHEGNTLSLLCAVQRYFLLNASLKRILFIITCYFTVCFVLFKFACLLCSHFVLPQSHDLISWA